MKHHGVVFWSLVISTALVLLLWVLQMLERGGYL